MFAIDVRHLAKTYPGGFAAVRDVSFQVERGEVFGLLGPNGAGKSTTIGMLTTTIRPTAGVALVSGRDVASDPLGARGASSVVFQDAVVDRALTGRQNLDIHARLWGVDRGTASLRIDDLADSFGLADLLARRVETYSGGQRRRLEIARALVSQPDVLFLDEPTVGLDPRIRYELLDVIAGLRGRGQMTMLVTTHYLDEAERLCDRVAIMHRGEIVALDTPSALLARLGQTIVEFRVDGNPRAALNALLAHGVAPEGAFVVGSSISLPLHDASASEVVTQIRDLGIATAVATRPPTLDDVYLQLTGDSLAA